MSARGRSWAPWLVLAAAVLFSTGGVAIKSAPFTAAQVSCLRSGLAALLLLAFSRGHLPMSRVTVVAGLCYAASLTLFVAATKHTTAASAIFLQSVAPLYLMLAGPWLGERLEPRDRPHAAALAVGLLMCLVGQGTPTESAPNPSRGNIEALASGVAWAATLASLRHLGQTSHDPRTGLAAVIAGNGLACVLALPSAWPLPAASPLGWASIAYLGLFQIGLAYICLTRAMRHVSALETSLLLLVEPVLNPMWTWWLFGEVPHTATLLGGAVIVGAICLRALSNTRA